MIKTSNFYETLCRPGPFEFSFYIYEFSLLWNCFSKKRKEGIEKTSDSVLSKMDLIVRVDTRGFHWMKRVVLKRGSSQEIQRNACTWFPNWQVLHPDVCSYVCFLNKIVILKTKSAREGYTLLCCWYWFIHLH